MDVSFISCTDTDPSYQVNLEETDVAPAPLGFNNSDLVLVATDSGGRAGPFRVSWSFRRTAAPTITSYLGTLAR